MVAPEPPDALYHLTSLAGIAGLMALYAFGAGLRTVVAPPPGQPALRWQLLASVPVGLLTAAFYAKNAFPSLTTASTSFVADMAVMSGHTIVLGMLSREALDRMLKALHPNAREKSDAG